MKRYLKSGFNTIQDIKLEAGTYTLVLYVKNMYSNVYTFALGDGIDWMEYDVDVIQGKLCKVWVTFTTIRGATKFKPIARNYSLEFPVYVADLQLTRGNVPVEAGASPFDVDQILDDLHDDIDGIEDFTNEAFRDGLLDREEKTQLRSSLDAIGSIVESVKGSYDKLLDNPFISNNTMTSITNRYYDFIASWLSDGDPRGLKPVILWIVNGDNIISVEERDEKNRALSAFNVALYKYNQAEKEIYNDIGDNSIAPIIIDGFWAFWNPKKWNVKTNTYGDFEKSKFSAEGDDGHSPYVDVLTKTWWEWDPNLWNPFTNKYGDYWDTGVRAEGLDAKLIDIQSTPTAITVKGDQSSSPWIFISATTENAYTDIDSWKFFIDDLVVEDKTSIAFYNGQEHFWVVKVYDMLELYPDIKSLGVSVKSMDETPITKSIDIPVVREGTDGLNTATVYLYKRIPEGAIKLWSSTGTFIFNEDEIPQEGEWTEPAVIIDTPDFEVVFSSSPTTPGEPYGHPNQNSDWVNIADETTTWMATSKLENEEWSPWEVSKTKDDNNLEFTVFTRSDVYPGRPEGGTYADPFPETPGWSSGIPRSIIYPIRETLTYSFIDKKFIAGNMNGWSLNIPNGVEQLYVIGATARSRFDIDEISPNEWSGMVEMGRDGFNSASITLYQRNWVKPLVPQSDCEYTFKSGELTNIEEEGWLRGIPSGHDELWVTTATAISTFATDVITSIEWADPTVMAKDGQGVLKSTAFIRINKEPKTPTGGRYINPNPEFDSEIGEEWSDGIPSGDERLWASTRIFTTDGLEPQQEAWTKPEVMVDSAGFDVEFSSVEEPGIPYGHPNENPNWSNTADETTIWMATSNFKDGEWSQWTISKIKGEKGEKGDSGTSISIKGKVADPSKLEELTPGDTRYLGRGYISEDTGDLWLFDGVTQGVYLDKDKIERYATFGWTNVGKIQGDSNYIHIAWADNVEFNLDGKFESIDGFTLEDTNKKRWYGLYVDDIKEDALEINAHKYNWVDTKGEAGKDSKSDEYIYTRNNNSGFGIAENTPTSEPDVQDFVPDNWTDNPEGVDETHLYEWVSKRKFRENEDGEMEWGAFSTPSIWGIFVTDGDPGKDSKSDEYIYIRNNNSGFGIADNRPPNNPQEDDYIPRELGWTDNPQGVTESEQYEFVSKRIFRNDKWSDFSIPSLWAKWSQDAKNPYAAYDKTIGGQYNDGKKYWFVWHALEKKYVNSGDPSQGDDGNQPRINSEGFWEVWGDTGDGTLGYVPTTIKARGEDGVSSFKSVVFKRYVPTTDKPTPDTPRAIDGSYAKPVPTGWSDGIPNGDGVLWASTRVFAENGATPPQQDVWTTPEVMADSAGFDVEFSSIETNPGDPTKNPGYWSNTADETTIWMATSNLENGIWSKWSIAKIKGEGGKDGLHGVNTATIYLYKRYSGLKTDIPMPINTLTYNFTNEELTGTTNGWYRNIPAGSNQLYVIGATASSRADTDKIYANEWSDAVELATDGFNSASITLYQRKATIPNVPINNCVYTFKSGTLTNFTQQGWYRGVPTSEANTKLWVTTATAISTEPTDVITSSEWADPTVMAEDGKGISEVKDFYGLSSIETSEPTKWFSYIPNKAVDEYLWNYEEIIYTDGNSIETKKRIIQGKDARSIKSVVNAYAYSSSDTVSPTSGWMSTIESLGEKPDGYFLWVRDDITYTDGTSSSTKGYVVKDGKDSYSVTLSKDSHTYTYDKDGNLKGYLSDGATTISVQRGDIFFKCDTTSIGYVPVNNNTYRVVAISVAGVSYSSATRAIVNNEFKIWPSAFTGETGSLTFTIRAMSDGVVSKDFKKTISFSKNRDGKDGQPGGNGLPGQIPIKKEWKLNDLHRNNDDVVDYIYYRGVNAEASYWYKLKNKGDRNNDNYSTPLPNNSTFKSLYESIDWLKALAVDVLLAEEANVAGFIFKDNQLISEKGLLDGVVKKYGEIEDERKDDFIPNIILDGGKGNVKITGDVNATSGLIGGMVIKDGNLISTRGKSYDDEEVVYGEYTQYQFNTSPLATPPPSSRETWTDLPSPVYESTYIQYKKNTETQWTQVRVGTSIGRWIVKYAETPNASVWSETFTPTRIWMQIKVGGEPTPRKAVKIDTTSGYDFIPNLTIDGARGTMKITGEINATSGMMGGMKIEGGMLVSQNGKVVVDGISNQIYLKDTNSDEIKTVLSPSKLPLTPSDYFGSSSSTNVTLENLKGTYTGGIISWVDLITIPSGDSSAYQITIPPITLYVDVDHPGGAGGNEHASLPNIGDMKVEIYKGGILQYNVSSASIMSTGGIYDSTVTTPLRSFTIQGSGTWSVRVTHVHTIYTLPSRSTAKVTNITGNAVVAKVVNSSAIGSNGMIIATSGTEYTYMVGDTYEVRRGNVGFRITDAGIQKSTNMNLSNPTWNNI